MLRDVLWELWSAALAVMALGASLVATLGLIWLVVTDPGRADVWVWGLAALSVAGDVVAAVRQDRRPSHRPRLAGLGWLASLVLGVLLILGAGGAGGVVVIGCVLVAKAVVDLPDAIGLWPSQMASEPSAPR